MAKAATVGDNVKPDKVNKAEAIRQTAKVLGTNARRRDVVAALKEKGISVSGPQVSITLRAASRRGLRRRARGCDSRVARHAATNHRNNVI